LSVKGTRKQEGAGNCMVTSFMICTPHYVRVIISRRMRWAVHVVRWERGEVCSRFWGRNLRERDY
jgi:hypothetical protein